MKYGETHPARDFLESIPAQEQTQFAARVRFFSDEGRARSREHGHWLEQPYTKIFEVKTRLHRFFGFIHATDFYIVHGASKKNPKAQRSDYEKAEKRRRNFLEGVEGIRQQ